MLLSFQHPARCVLVVFALLLVATSCDPSTASRQQSTAPVVYFQRAPVTGWQAIDWTGKLHGSVGSDRVGNPYQSPDGSGLLWDPNGAWQIVNRTGHVLSLADMTDSRGLTWADDSSGVCILRGTSSEGGSYSIAFDAATGGSRTIAALTTLKGPDVAACSPAASRVVIVTASGRKDPLTDVMRITFGELRVIDFKTGTVQFQQTFPVGGLSTEVNSVAVTHDGSFAALGTQTQTIIVNLLNGQVVSSAKGVTPLAFSWDGKLLALDGASNRGEVLNLSTGRVVWSDSTINRVTQGAVPNPAGSDVMLLVTGGALNDLLVVGAGGSAHVVAKGVFPDQIAPCSNCSAF